MGGVRTKVLYIIGWGRSGSTILDNVLGQLDGFFSTGEMHYVWDHLERRRPCGCGQPIDRCPVWSRVVAEVLDRDGRRGLEAADIVRWQRISMRLRHTPRLMRREPARLAEDAPLALYANVTSRLYNAIGRISGARVIVDSTKRPPDAALLRLLPGIDAYILHLIRDPRAVAHSWQRRRPQLDRPTEMDRYSSFSSSINWLAWNVAAELICRQIGREKSLSVRYEDFVAQPLETVARIASLVGERPARLPFIDRATVQLVANHSVAGNPGRFRSGRPVPLRLDSEWETRQRLLDRATASAVSLPLLARYGYRLRTRLGGRAPAQ
jgi:Sulfotransferase family